MKTSELISYGSVLALSIVSVSACIWLTNVFSEALFLYITGKCFRRDLKDSIEHSKPTWLQICAIAETHNVSKRRAIRMIMDLQRELLTGREKDDEAKSKQTLLESYIDNHNREEPFEGLPATIRLSLEQLQKDLDTKTEALQPLTMHIKDLLKIHDTINRKQRLHTTGGFLIGIAGVLLGTYTYFNPLSP